ncbi:hypothetical protein CPC08DRAFT_726184 [Agrocybe pediades]|nr:hypothetical protein CPC08DRAFT_726184 [Agrocybe pediades]
MNSSTSRTAAKRMTQEEIKQQIALLQSRLEPESDPEPEVAAGTPKSPKRKVAEPVTLVPETPSPSDTATHNTISGSKGKQRPEEQFKKLAPSTFVNKLATRRRDDDDDEPAPVTRSTGFNDRPKDVQPVPVDEHVLSRRNEQLEIVEELQPGPYEHKPPHDDPNFERLEPHSGIHMVSRAVSHEELSDHMLGRYYLSPSRLYSAVRLLPDKKGYDVPVPGDWVTIAVVAERGPIRFTRAPVAVEKEADDPDPKKKWKGKEKDNEPERPSGKKYVNLKLIDFGARAGSSSSATGRVGTIRGDAFLTLLLFESDGFDLVPREDGMKPEKIYKGGSRGAFEHLTNVKEGDVIALLNPKILKPFQRSNDTPHPVNNTLALTPESASSIIVLGKSRDLGMCTVRKQDGKVCGSWCDKRVSDVCEYHVHNAVKRQRAARPEFSIGTSGMSTSSTHKSKNGYDPLRKWGLKPADDTGPGSTYVVSGHVVSGSSGDPRTLYVSETIGREGQAKAKRIMNGKDADKELKALLQRDKDGMKAVMKAREAVRAKQDVKKEKSGKESSASSCSSSSLPKKSSRGEDRKGKKKAELKDLTDSDDDGHLGEENVERKSEYSASVIKSLGFDPTLKPGQRKKENKGAQEKLAALEALQNARKDIALGPKPGPRIRSGVFAPKQEKPSKQEVKVHDGGGSDDELPDRVSHRAGGEEEMIDLDDF